MNKLWAKTTQRNDLKSCPFCFTTAIHQMRLADNQTDMHHQIQCGNPFCDMVCKTNICASEHDAVSAWENRPQPPLKLWLWKNGDHYWAFQHLYPCHMDGGDPQTLGEPVAYAIFKPSAPPADGPHKGSFAT